MFFCFGQGPQHIEGVKGDQNMEISKVGAACFGSVDKMYSRLGFTLRSRVH